MSRINNYNHKKIESKAQERWEKQGVYRAEDNSKKPKFYCLVEFPYPSGAGLHVGHLRSYSALDAVARKKRMQGFNVLYPMGWDAFGLPTENYAIKTGKHPRAVTQENIKIFKKQTKSVGLSFDWSREINTTDPEYYKHTQWIFLQLYKNNLAYQDKMPINWCPSCKTGLANEEVVNNKCERCGAKTTKKMQKQWMLRITKYADRLLQDLKTVDYLDKIRIQQENWIGKSSGAEIDFSGIKVFTTRADTIFGATYMVVCPEHKIISNQLSVISNQKEIKKYIQEASKKSDLDRDKNKTGVEIKGIKAINPANGEEIPIWIADYVLPHYGTGAIMAVPAHDERDWDFLKYDSKKINVIEPPTKGISLNEQELNLIKYIPDKDQYASNINKKDWVKQELEFIRQGKRCYEGEGILRNSVQFNGMTSQKARDEIVNWLAKNKLAKKAVNYKLRDWVFSRQHYWGEPIPIVYCENCAKKEQEKNGGETANLSSCSCEKSASGGSGDISTLRQEHNNIQPKIIPVPEKDLPVKLPDVKNYKPTNTGESPLAKIKNWVNTECPKCNAPAKRETDTMPNWAGSSWYFLRYCDPKNNKAFASKKKLKYWTPVDLYNGGMEHTTLHLLYSRFWHKFLFDLKLVPTKEPYQARRSHGMVLAEDGRKMSKSFGNVINPDEVIKKYGADTLRLYEMFMGPFGEAIPWSEKSISGMRRFLEKIWRLKPQEKNNQITHKTIKKITQDIDNFKFNTAIACLMEYVNSGEYDYKTLIKLLAPFAPHITEELYPGIHQEPWPKFDEKQIQEQEFDLVIQVNGKMRDKIKVQININQKQAIKLVQNLDKFKNLQVKKFVFVKNRLVNLVV